MKVVSYITRTHVCLWIYLMGAAVILCSTFRVVFSEGRPSLDLRVINGAKFAIFHCGQPQPVQSQNFSRALWALHVGLH